MPADPRNHDDDDDDLADFTRRLQRVDTVGPMFYRSMTLPGPLRKYRQWTPCPSDDVPTAVGASEHAVVAPDLQRRVDTLEAELARRAQVEADLLRRVEALERSVGAWRAALQSTPVSWTEQPRDDSLLRDGRHQLAPVCGGATVAATEHALQHHTPVIEKPT